ncbi:MAG: acetyltransferase [Coriobacteriia bacterium]|nr:acetyltransferase [Coriobacteriia bacterium]
MRLIVIGAGGHAKVVVDAALACGISVVGAVAETGGVTDVFGVPVVADAAQAAADAFIVAVGDNRARATLFAEYSARGLVPAAVVHPSAIIATSVKIAPGAFIAAGVVVNPDARIGANVILNTACTVDHDCIIGDHAHVGPGANLCGGASVGEGALIGVGACAMPRVSIGAWSVVGAGSAVTSDLPDGMVCVGVPSRPLHPVKDAT